MIGQNKFKENVSKYNIDNFPRSTLLVGEKGMGKHTAVDYISANILHLNIIDISENIDDEYIDNIYSNPNPFIYIIDLSKITEKEQNTCLKLIEEPLKNSYIFILCENINLVLNTVVNRCYRIDLEPYSKDELNNFISNDEEHRDEILELIKSPGKLLTTSFKNILDMKNVCEKICTKLNVANYSNTLSIANKINFKDEYDKFDLEIFMDCLCKSLFSNYLLTNNINLYKMYELTRDQRKLLVDKRLNKELFFESFLSMMWKISRGVCYYGY